MNFIHIQVPEEKAYILPIGDVHFGDKAFGRIGKEKLKGNLEWAVANNAHVLLMGDIFNIAGRDTKTSPYENNPDEITEAEEFFEPYKSVIKGGIRGNHERRIVNAYGHDPLKGFCKHLGIPYLGVSALVRIQVGKRPDSDSYWNNYYMAIHHTTGGGGTIGNALNAVAKLERIIPGCDIYAGGHNHQLVTGSQQRYVPTYSGPVLKRTYFVSCGSYLDYPNSYAEEGMMVPGKLGSPRIRFSGLRDHHDVHVSL